MASQRQRLETTIAQGPRHIVAADDRVAGMAEAIFVRLISSRTAEGRTPAHWASVAFEAAKAFVDTADTLTPDQPEKDNAP
jgi:hypothetical protein